MPSRGFFKVLLLCFIFGTLTPAVAQKPLEVLHSKSKQTHIIAMPILGGWAIGNLAVSGLLLDKSSGPERHFHQMNLGWNSMNLLIAGFGLREAMRPSDHPPSLEDVLRRQRHMEQLMLINAGLDLAYIAGGIWMMSHHKAAGEGSDQLMGYGQSVILQGGFLFLFDSLTYLIHKHHYRQFEKNWHWQMTGNGVTLYF